MAALIAAAASIRLAPTAAFPSATTSHASTSGSTSSSHRNRQHLSSRSLLCNLASASKAGGRSEATAPLSASHSFVVLPSEYRISRNAASRSPLGSPGRRFGVRCQGENGAQEKTPFGYTRKDVILIGAGLLVFGVGLKYGLESFGFDSIKAGNVVQLVMVLGLTVGWISTYIFRVSSKDMTYAKQLRDYEQKVMEKRLEEMPEAELESMLAQIEEDKRILQENRDKLL